MPPRSIPNESPKKPRGPFNSPKNKKKRSSVSKEPTPLSIRAPRSSLRSSLNSPARRTSLGRSSSPGRTTHSHSPSQLKATRRAAASSSYENPAGPIASARQRKAEKKERAAAQTTSSTSKSRRESRDNVRRKSRRDSRDQETKRPVKLAVAPPEVEEEEDAITFEDEFDPFLLIKTLPPLADVVQLPRQVFCIPPKASGGPRHTLALDLDETLVHCSIQPIENYELMFGVQFNGVPYRVYVRTRPYLRRFLQRVAQWFEIVVFTASQQVYADKLLDLLDPQQRWIQHRVFRDSCVCVDGNYLKDLTILGRDMRRIALVDNSPQAFGFQLNNGIPIESWFDDPNDRELLNLLPFLKHLKDVPDVRPFIRDTFKIEQYVRSLPDF